MHPQRTLTGFICALVFSGGSGGQPVEWTPMIIEHHDAETGTLADHYVVKSISTPGSQPSVAEALSDLAGVLSYRPIAGGSAFTGSTYHLVRTSPLMTGDALGAAIRDAIGDDAEIKVTPTVVGAATDTHDDPNDPHLFAQYAIENVGQNISGVAGRPGADVRATQAWEIQRGSAQVRIAVIDAGVSSSHPDLVSKLDGGMNVITGAADDTDAPFNSHGTHIAGIVGASTNNAEGVVGVSWGSRIVPVTAANPLGFTSDAWLAEGLIWAADQGVDVAVMSFGLSEPSDVLHDAVRYAYDRGVIVCASSGNGGVEGVLYPAAYPEALAIGATDNTDVLAAFSNTGPEIEFVAPGVDILSTWHTNTEPDSYRYSSGTSVSTPIVAGVAALLRSSSPDLSVEGVREVLARTSRDLGDFGRDPKYGFGRVNAHRALQELTGEDWCYADVNGSGTVEPTDFSAWIAIYAMGDLRADQNRNGWVEPSDFNAFVFNYNQNQHGCR